MTTLTHILHDSLRDVPERVAVRLLYPRAPEVEITYRRLMQGAAGYAKALGERGIRPGEVVILVLQHSEDLVYSFFGAILHGAIPSIMPFLTEKLSPEKYQEDMTALIGITAPAAIVTYPEFLDTVKSTLRQGDSVRAVLVTSEVTAVEQPDFSTLAGLGRDENDIVLLQHSSGTTGLQKGVALAHRAVINQLESYARAIRLTLDDVVVSWLPLYHDMGLIAGFIMPILNRIPLVLMSPFDWVRAPYRLMQAVSQYRGTLTWLPNFAYNFCAQKIRERDLQGVDLSSWRAVINCSEPMRWESHQAFIKRFQPYGLNPSALATCYAMAENVFAVTQGGIDAPLVVDEIDSRAFISQHVAISASEGETIKMLSAGPAIDNTQVKVLATAHSELEGAENGDGAGDAAAERETTRRELPDRQVGELALRSNCMLTGYYRREEATEKAFDSGWYLTGDLGYKVGEQVYVVGRKKDMIIVGGKNIYPQDLETLANQVPGVHPGRVVAFGVFDEEQGTEEVVMIAEADSEDPDERLRIADEIRARVTRGSAVALRTVEIVPPRWILKTSSGKTARGANREKYLAEFANRA